MADKTVNARLKNKADTSDNWAKATSFVPLAGELIFYTDLNKVKMGDGKTAVSSLPFFSSDADLNIENGSGTGSAQMKQDGTSGTFDFTNKNANATALDGSLTGDIPFGATERYASSFGGKSSAQGKRSFACGTTTIAKGAYSFASGDNSVAFGADSHAEGSTTTAYGDRSHAEGYNTVSKNFNSHAEGESTTASGHSSHAEGSSTTASGEVSHAEGSSTVASGKASHAGGESTQAKGERSFAHGNACVVDDAAKNAVAFGYNTVALSNNEVAIGQYNNTYTKPDYAYNSMFSVGIGTSIKDRKNAFTVLSDGRAKVTASPTDDDDVVRKAELDKLVKLTPDEKSWIDDTKEYIKYNITDNYGSIEHQLIIANPSSDAPTIDTQSGYIKAQYFQGDQLVNSNGNALARYKSAENKSVFGSSKNGALIMGNDLRLHYSNSESDFTGLEVAYVKDLPSRTVYQHYIKITFANSTGCAYISINSTDSKYSSIQALCEYVDGRGIQQIPATGYFIDDSDYFMIIGGSPYMYGPGTYRIMFDMYSPVSNTHKTYDGMTIASISDIINKIALIDMV